MPCNPPIFQDNSKIKDPTVQMGALEKAVWMKPIVERAFLHYLVDVKRPGEGVRDHDPKKFCRGHPVNYLVVKVKLQVMEETLFGENCHGFGLGSVGREMVV